MSSQRPAALSHIPLGLALVLAPVTVRRPQADGRVAASRRLRTPNPPQVPNLGTSRVPARVQVPEPALEPVRALRPRAGDLVVANRHSRKPNRPLAPCPGTRQQ
jgi:hypothetical protein